jgi:hypothetical protein
MNSPATVQISAIATLRRQIAAFSRSEPARYPALNRPFFRTLNSISHRNSHGRKEKSAD